MAANAHSTALSVEKTKEEAHVADPDGTPVTAEPTDSPPASTAPSTPDESESELAEPPETNKPEASTSTADAGPSKDAEDSTAKSDTTVTPELSALSSISEASQSRRKKLKRIISSANEDSTVSEVLAFGAEGVAKRRVVFPANLVAPTLSAQGDFAYQRSLGDGDFVASGHLHVTHQKSPKNARDNSYIFYVVEGAVTVRIHQTYHTIHQGGMFMVPRGNTYSIENISPSSTPARLVFTQARESVSSSSASEDPLRLVKRVRLPAGLTTSKTFLLLGWIIERLLKRFHKYQQLAAVFYRRTRFLWNQHVHGTRAYIVFFLLGWLVRSLPMPWGSRVPRVNVQFIREAPRGRTRP